MDKMEMAVTLYMEQFANLAVSLASDANLIEESKNDGGCNPPKLFASLIRSERDREGCQRVTLEVTVAYDWGDVRDREHRVVQEKYLLALVRAISIFPG